MPDAAPVMRAVLPSLKTGLSAMICELITSAVEGVREEIELHSARDDVRKTRRVAVLYHGAELSKLSSQGFIM